MDANDPVDIMARTLWGEARGEGQRGMENVANVIMNRVKKPCWWGDDVISVCRKKWQFSCWNEGDPNCALLKAVTSSDPQFSLARKIAELAIAGRLLDLINSATHYYDIRMPKPPAWAAELKPIIIIGHHAFFKNVP